MMEKINKIEFKALKSSKLTFELDLSLIIAKIV